VEFIFLPGNGFATLPVLAISPCCYLCKMLREKGKKGGEERKRDEKREFQRP
jgi:hypothetical protein